MKRKIEVIVSGGSTSFSPNALISIGRMYYRRAARRLQLGISDQCPFYELANMSEIVALSASRLPLS